MSSLDRVCSWQQRAEKNPLALICLVASCLAWLASSSVEGDASCVVVLASSAWALPSAASCLLKVTVTGYTALCAGLWQQILNVTLGGGKYLNLFSFSLLILCKLEFDRLKPAAYWGCNYGWCKWFFHDNSIHETPESSTKCPQVRLTIKSKNKDVLKYDDIKQNKSWCCHVNVDLLLNLLTTLENDHSSMRGMCWVDRLFCIPVEAILQFDDDDDDDDDHHHHHHHHHQ